MVACSEKEPDETPTPDGTSVSAETTTETPETTTNAPETTTEAPETTTSAPETTVPVTTEHTHTLSVLEAVAPTCTEAGKTEGSVCSVCGETVKAQEEIAPLGHTEVIYPAVAPTCTETGKSEGSHCSVCGTVLKAQEQIVTIGHEPVIDAAVAPTCTETGKSEGSHCSVCGYVYKAQETVAALGHTEIIDAAVSKTCTSNGKTEGSHCSVCNTVLKAQEVIPAGHTEVIQPAVAPTYTDSGKTEGKACSACGAVLVAQTTVPRLELIVAEGSSGKMYISMSGTKVLNAIYARDELVRFVKNSTGASLPAGTATRDFELLLGDTGRAESAALKATLSGDKYAIKIENSKIIIVATNDAFLYEAVEYFIKNYLTVSGNTVKVNTRQASYTGNGDTTTLRYLFSKSTTLYADNYYSGGWPDEIIKQPDGTTHVQGGCSDGTYIYQIFIKKDTASDERNNTCKIVKIKPDFNPNTTDNVVMTSANLDLNHANDITYNSKTKELIVCHNNPYRTKLSIIDPETLTVKRTVTIGQKIYGITYNEERNMYMVSCSSGQNMRTLSADFKTLSSTMTSTAPTQSMTTQGICSDDTYIYHTLWNSPGSGSNYNRNVITVYDWYGNYVGMIGTKITIESENIYFHDGNLYVAAYSGGAEASYSYRIEPFVK